MAADGYLGEPDTDASEELRHAATASRWIKLWTAPYYITSKQIK